MLAADYKSRNILAKFYVDMFIKVLSKLEIVNSNQNAYEIKSALMNPSQEMDGSYPVFVEASATIGFDEETPGLDIFSV